jgi:hypothetical protein
MSSSLADLITESTEEDREEFVLTQLAGEGFPVTAWDDLGVGLSIAKILSRSTQDSADLIARLARGGLLDLASGGWLDLLAERQIFFPDNFSQIIIVRQHSPHVI